ncbi:lysophospholipid acyltransferase family protein [Vibrio cholerae]|uniref:lysophospholipid acyltransferase family protein n=1 Tax=Vibrio cholerae TaxID=666 RepID=UPI00226DC694|nr:GNAT family N-acyltransferase [Vibrio cholerae]MCX9566291.1 GNAT family N-acetyltransferase [Vibrio cholerae]MCX9569772.1 GNAT family N-acetyltransferase [Vibrio cholerae]MCX9587012.1 GNAT family N-acetyltransferase [Vibrio cholerae]
MLSTSPFVLPRKTPFGLGEHLAEWATGLKRLNQFYAQRPASGDTQAFLRFTLDVLGIDYQVVRGKLTHVPAQGATVVVANHPLGCVEGVILAELLLCVRSDVKILANQYLKLVPELTSLFIGVDVFEGADAAKANLHALRQAHKHLEQGGLLLMFPAGEVSQLVDSKQGRLEDKEWSQSVSRLVKKHQAHTVPVYIDGHNSTPFYLAGKIHPMLRTLMLGRELLNKQHTQIGIAIGEGISHSEVQHLCDQQLVNYLRLNTYLLQSSPVRNKTASDRSLPPVAERLPLADLLEDIAQLPYADHMLRHNQFDVYCTTADNIPSLMHEIGRIRELNFREVGEGTGCALDIDRFDRDYLHLFIWDREKNQLVGAYRLGLVDKLIEHKGISGLYSSTLFHYDQRFLNNMGNAIEMGRSVIDSQYQKSMAALLLLWKGIGTYVERHPQYTHLFGPVSISNDYSEQARRLLADTMTLHYYDSEQAELVMATNPLPTGQAQWNASLLTSLADLQLLSRVIARIDEGKGIPVLLRQYLGLNGKLVSFNVDPAFNNALDGLIVVDLRNVPTKTLARYMGQSEALRYLATHQYFSDI